jgi:hypothetical protein
VIPVAASADGHALAEQYEELRQEVIDKAGCVARGLALLMREGMAAWMRGIEQAPPLVAAAPAAPGDRLPEGIERGLIDIVAAMALATTTATTTTGGVT